MSADPAQILDFVRSQREPFVDYVRRLAEIESPTHDAAGVRRVQDALRASLTELGFRAHVYAPVRTGDKADSGPSTGFLYAVPARRRRPAPVQLVVGHCDTVWPVGTTRTMPVHVDGDALRGPGVFDMKAGLAQIVFALRALHHIGVEPPLTPVVTITSDEEAGSLDSAHSLERLARCSARALVLEPALGPRGRIKTARKGTGRFDIVVRGRAAHAGIAPEEGASAILELAHVIQALFALNDVARGVTVNVGTISGGLRANVVAPESCAAVDVRVASMEDARRVEEAIRGIAPRTPGVAIEVSGAVDREPMERTPRNQALWRQLEALGDEIGLALEEGMSGGASDGNITSRFTATIDGLGAVGDGAHAHREYIDVPSTLDRCALLALVLAAPAAAD